MPPGMNSTIHLLEIMRLSSFKSPLFYPSSQVYTDLLLDVAVGVIDDGQEHVQEHKEHEEEVGHEEDGAQDSGEKIVA